MGKDLSKLGTHSILVDGELESEIPDSSVYVSSSSELSGLTDMPIGTIAIQYGFVNMWQLKPDRTWIQI